MIRYLWAKLVCWGWDYTYDAVNPHDRGRERLERTVLVTDDDLCEESISLPDPIRFSVQSVAGGTLVETRWYDHKKDENRVKLHIITQDENVGEAIGKIVTMELLQR